MTGRREFYDAIAARVKEAPEPVGLEALFAEIPLPPNLTRDALTAAMKVRSIILTTDDLLSVTAPRTDPGSSPDYSGFAPTVRMTLEQTDHPIDTDELLTALALPDSAVPFTQVDRYLKAAGLHYIIGLGWWTAPQWMDSAGNVFSIKPRDSRVATAMQILEDYGWPLHDKRIAELSKGEIKPDFFNGNRSGNRRYFKNIGMRLIVPASAEGRIPMSPALAKNMLNMTRTQLLTSKDNRTAYLIAMIMGRLGLATLKRGATRRGGKGMRTIRMTLTKEGRAELERQAFGTTRDAVEVI